MKNRARLVLLLVAVLVVCSLAAPTFKETPDTNKSPKSKVSTISKISKEENKRKEKENQTDEKDKTPVKAIVKSASAINGPQTISAHKANAKIPKSTGKTVTVRSGNRSKGQKNSNNPLHVHSTTTRPHDRVSKRGQSSDFGNNVDNNGNKATNNANNGVNNNSGSGGWGSGGRYGGNGSGVGGGNADYGDMNSTEENGDRRRSTKGPGDANHGNDPLEKGPPGNGSPGDMGERGEGGGSEVSSGGEENNGNTSIEVTD